MVVEFSRRTNDQWLADLRSDGLSAREAHEDLRETIRLGLAKVLAKRGGVDENTLEDITQDAAVRVLKKLDSFRGESRFTTWVMAIAIRVAYTALRRNRWREASLTDLGIGSTDFTLEPEAKAERPEDHIQQQMILDVMHRVIKDELTEKQRMALLGELAGMPQVIVAEQLKTNRNALYKLVHDARKRLKEGLIKAGITEQEVRTSFSL